jgi:hypothetical protein
VTNSPCPRSDTFAARHALLCGGDGVTIGEQHDGTRLALLLTCSVCGARSSEIVNRLAFRRWRKTIDAQPQAFDAAWAEALRLAVQ